MLKLALSFFAALVLLGVAAIALSWLCIDWNEEGADEYPGGVVLRDAAGNVLRVSLGPHDVDCRPYYEADPDDWVVKALVAVEDGEFWNHHGVRPLSMLRAFFQNVFYRRRISGASTITMQTVRLILPHRKSYWRKWVEAFEAMKMERRRSKRWILSQYLNRAPYGSNFIGIEAAANGWFGRGAKELGLGEAAMLAAMVQAPSRFRPDRGYDAAFKRRDYVLERMRRVGYIDDAQLEGARGVAPIVCRAPRPFKAPYYCDFVMRELGFDRAAQRKSGDYRTPLEPDVQELCERAVNAAARDGGYSVAAVVMRPAGGEVIALACSGDYFDPSGGQVNTALAPRPAGSTLKPFLVALALDAGIATPEEKLRDAPMARKGYRPANFDASYRGLVSVRDALVLSLNIPFVQLLEKAGLERFGTTLRDLGFSGLSGPTDTFGLGMAIGNVEVSLVELVRAYGVLARGGADVFSRGAAYLVSDMLSGAERSGAALGHIADVRLPRFAWKTGTSAAYRDAWTVAWNPEYVIGVWCGHKRGGFGDTSLVGAKAAAPVAWTIARALYPQGEGPWFVEPGDVGRRMVCAETGLPASADCPAVEEGRFLRGRSFSIPCASCGGEGLEKIYDLRLTDSRLNCCNGNNEPLQSVNRKSKIENAHPSPFTLRPSPFTFLRPEDGAVFTRIEGMGQQKVVCEVADGADEAALWWFVDGVPTRRTVGTRRFAVEMEPGDHTVTCATADGESATVRFTVK